MRRVVMPFVASTVKLKIPVCVGVPEITTTALGEKGASPPLSAMFPPQKLMPVRPGGKAVGAAMQYGTAPASGMRVKLYGTPVIPDGS